MLTRWTKKIHMYAGLLNFTILMVFGVAGIRATLQTPRQGATEVETRQFRVPPNLDDFQAAQAAFQFVNAPLSQPPTQRNVHRDGQNDVTFDMGTINGPRTVTLIETQDELRIETHRNRLSAFIDNMHATTMNTTNPDIRFGCGRGTRNFQFGRSFSCRFRVSTCGGRRARGHRWAQ